MKPSKTELDILAAKIRKTALYSFRHLGFGHLGGSLSISVPWLFCTDLL